MNEKLLELNNLSANCSAKINDYGNRITLSYSSADKEIETVYSNYDYNSTGRGIVVTILDRTHDE